MKRLLILSSRVSFSLWGARRIPRQPDHPSRRRGRDAGLLLGLHAAAQGRIAAAHPASKYLVGGRGVGVELLPCMVSSLSLSVSIALASPTSSLHPQAAPIAVHLARFFSLFFFSAPPVSLPRFSQCRTPPSPQDLYQGDSSAH